MLAMKTTIEIPDALFAKSKIYAAEHGLAFRELVEAGLRQVVDSKRARAQPFRLRKAAFKGRGLISGGDWQDIRRAIYEGRGE